MLSVYIFKTSKSIAAKINLIYKSFINTLYFSFWYIITFIDKDFLLKTPSDINIKFILMKINVKNLNKRKCNIFEYAIIPIYLQGNINRISLLKKKI